MQTKAAAVVKQNIRLKLSELVIFVKCDDKIVLALVIAEAFRVIQFVFVCSALIGLLHS